MFCLLYIIVIDGVNGVAVAAFLCISNPSEPNKLKKANILIITAINFNLVSQKVSYYINE